MRRRDSPLLSVRAKTTGRRPRLPAEPWVGGELYSRKALNEYEFELLSSFAPKSVMQLFVEDTCPARVKLVGNTRHMIVAVRARGGLQCGVSGTIRFRKQCERELEIINGEAESVRMCFDKTYTEAATQEDVYVSLVKPYLNTLLEAGGEGAVLAYGMTGSGKTFTIQGQDDNPGMTTRLFRQIFNDVLETDEKTNHTRCQTLSHQYNIHVSSISSAHPSFDTSN